MEVASVLKCRLVCYANREDERSFLVSCLLKNSKMTGRVHLRATTEAEVQKLVVERTVFEVLKIL